MARRVNTDIAGITINYPELRVFSANPNYLTVTGLAAIQNPIEIQFNGNSVKRYADFNLSAKFQLQGIFASFFAGAEFGNVLPATSRYAYVNNGSKSIKVDSLVYITTYQQTATVSTTGAVVTASIASFASTNVGKYILIKGVPKLITGYTDSTHITISSPFIDDVVNEPTWNIYVGLLFDIVYGALQIGEVEPNNVPLYQFGSLPLTVTQTKGNNFTPQGEATISLNGYGKEIDMQFIIEDYPNAISFQFDTSVVVEKVFNLFKSTCENGVYLRWMSACQGYKYFLFNTGDTTQELKDGAKFNFYIDSIDASSEGLIKGDSQLKAIDGNPVQLCGISTSDINIQRHLFDLPMSKNVWKWENETWIEVNKEMKPIVIDRFESSKQIDIKIISPKLYNTEI